MLNETTISHLILTFRTDLANPAHEHTSPPDINVSFLDLKYFKSNQHFEKPLKLTNSHDHYLPPIPLSPTFREHKIALKNS